MTTLLLADDSLTIQRVIELTFADEGIRVVSVSDGESAIARLESDPPDIVLADVGMPNVDGYQVAARVKATPALAHVPVLLLTGAFEPVDEIRVREAGGDGVLTKPFEPRHLIAAVRELLDGVKQPAPAPADRTASAENEAPVVEAVVESEPEPVPELTTEAPRPSVQEPGPALGDEALMVPPPARAAQPADRPAPPATGSLASVFSALLAAERGHPEGRLPRAAAPALSEAAIELVVERVVKRMAGEMIRKTVLETAERLIREELDRSKLQA